MGGTRRPAPRSVVAEGELKWTVCYGDTPHPGHDVDGDAHDDGSGDDHGRWARHLDNRRRLRRRLAIGLAAAGAVAIVVGLSWHPGKTTAHAPSPSR